MHPANRGEQMCFETNGLDAKMEALDLASLGGIAPLFEWSRIRTRVDNNDGYEQQPVNSSIMDENIINSAGFNHYNDRADPLYCHADINLNTNFDLLSNKLHAQVPGMKPMDSKKALATQIKCTCQRNKCAKAYCQCVRNGVSCDPIRCACTGCVNKKEEY